MEYIKANGVEYAYSSVITGIDSISFLIVHQKVADMEEAFRPVTELTVADENKEVYGVYKNLSFESATAYVDGTVMVTMHIKSDTELRFESLEQTNIMLRVIRRRMAEGEELEDILAGYPKLTDAEKEELRAAITD